MPDVLTDLSEPALIRAIEQNFAFAWSHFSLPPVGEIHREPERLWYRTGRDSFVLNAVLGARFPAEEADRRIESTLEPFRDLPMAWITGPSTTPADLGDRLLAHGLTKVEDLPGMALVLADLAEPLAPPKGVQIRQVDDDPVALRVATEIMATVLDLPQLVFDTFLESLHTLGEEDRELVFNYLATVDGRPIATSTLMLGAGVAGIYDVATLPEARGRGIGTAMSLRPLLDARTHGYRAAVLQSSAAAFGLYRRLGFRELCWLTIYAVTQPGAQVPAG